MRDMRIAIPLLIIAVVIITHLVVGRITQHRANEKLERVQHWKALPIEQRLLAHTEFTEELICNDADRARNAWTFCLSVAAAGLLMIVWLDDNTTQVSAQADESNAQATENCRNFRTLVQLLGDQYTEEIRELTVVLESDPESNFQDFPGYANLAPAVRQLLGAFAAQQVIEAQEDLEHIRHRADIIRDFEDSLNCPG